MNSLQLTLFSRDGCCLCRGLEERLRSLSLDHLNPPLELRVIDIDDADTPKDIRAKYDLQVPVMLIGRSDFKESVELPRVSPRLNSEGLYQWLEKLLIKISGLT
tara:strand:+ start:96 stop:407 length:312 start_codon:yes stop_codon:yes gene_type:complete